MKNTLKVLLKKILLSLVFIMLSIDLISANSYQNDQVILVVGTGGYNAKISLYEKNTNNTWTQVLTTNGFVGKNGITDNKREGDGKTPTGIYTLGTGFGVQSNPGTNLSYRKVNNNDYWVDDQNSKYYNQWVDITQVKKDWRSAEHLYSYKTAYKYGIVVNYNMKPIVPGKGSAIFIHNSTNGPTAGCISMPESSLVSLMKMLNPNAKIIIAKDSQSIPRDILSGGVSYQTHIQEYGWQDWKSNGQMAGTSGESKRLEAIQIKLNNHIDGTNITYRAHIQEYGWQDWKRNGEISGTNGQGKRLEAIEIKLENAPGYRVEYNVHIEDYGWQGWKTNGQLSGTIGQGKRLEAIEVRVVRDNTPIINPEIQYRTHVEDYGWQGWKYNSQMSGTSGESKRLEGIEIKLNNAPNGARIVYQTHIQDYGWQDWKSSGQMSGTSGQSKRLEGIRIKLENLPGYKVEYRVHVQNHGWQDWKSNGEMAGTIGESKRLEAIEVRLVKQ